ncbi:LacI family transcriptional regulator, partial [Staphylococcus arlettae]|uniref:LacI family DNA-binding transcriptional regulator n=1 Tax=Staphylococcus arlettae TaxID=29378 RepID=UPI000FF3E422
MKNIADIAKIAGVSKSTVSRYLNNGSVSRKTKEKLDAIIRQYDYQPNQFAQSLRAHKTNMIGAIIPRMNSYAVDETIKGVKNLCDSVTD